MVDPEAAAKRKIRKQQRKAAGKRKQMEHVKRLRSAGGAGAERATCHMHMRPCEPSTRRLAQPELLCMPHGVHP